MVENEIDARREILVPAVESTAYCRPTATWLPSTKFQLVYSARELAEDGGLMSRLGIEVTSGKSEKGQRVYRIP